MGWGRDGGIDGHELYRHIRCGVGEGWGIDGHGVFGRQSPAFISHTCGPRPQVRLVRPSLTQLCDYHKVSVMITAQVSHLS